MLSQTKIYSYRNDFKNIEDYYEYLHQNISNPIERIFFETARMNGLHIEWQKRINYRNEKNQVRKIHVDFYYQDLTGDIKIVIECDGKSHKEELRKCNDQIRDDYLLHQKGCYIYRFKSNDIYNSPLSLVEKIKNYISDWKDHNAEQAAERKKRIRANFKHAFEDMPVKENQHSNWNEVENFQKEMSSMKKEKSITKNLSSYEQSALVR